MTLVRPPQVRDIKVRAPFGRSMLIADRNGRPSACDRGAPFISWQRTPRLGSLRQRSNSMRPT